MRSQRICVYVRERERERERERKREKESVCVFVLSVVDLIVLTDRTAEIEKKRSP